MVQVILTDGRCSLSWCKWWHVRWCWCKWWQVLMVQVILIDGRC